MASTDDIRQWGRSNGFDVAEDGRLPAGLRAAYDSRNSDETETAADAAPEVSERPPAIPTVTPLERVRSLAKRAKATPAPKGRGRVAALRARVSTEKVISGAWSIAASLAVNFNPAVGRVLAMQAPVAGMVLEDKVKGTVLDRVLQPMARAADGGNTVMALVGPPVLVQALTMAPDRAGQIVPLLRYALRSWVMVAGDKMEAMQKEEEQFEDKYGKRVDEMIMYLLEGIPGIQFAPNQESE